MPLCLFSGHCQWLHTSNRSLNILHVRHHTIQHYKHLLETNMEQADREKEITIKHLADIDR